MQATEQPSRLDQLIPHSDFRECHHRVIGASRDRVYDAVWTVTLGEMPLVPLLFALRSLPAILAGKGSPPRKQDEPQLPQMIASGFTLLAHDPGREVVVGTIEQMCQPGGVRAGIHDADEFLAFDQPGFVKVAMNFTLSEHEGATRLVTETRILGTDRRARRKFALYWLLIRLGSGAIRRSWLRAIARRAERAVSPGEYPHRNSSSAPRDLATRSDGASNWP